MEMGKTSNLRQSHQVIGPIVGEIGLLSLYMGIRRVAEERHVVIAIMVFPVALCYLVSGLVVGQAWGYPLPLQPLQSESHPLALVSDLSTRLGTHPSRLQEARLPLPSSQDLEAIKKVAQILVTLGQQVIPAIIGEPITPGNCNTVSRGEDIPNDPVNINDRQA